MENNLSSNTNSYYDGRPEMIHDGSVHHESWRGMSARIIDDVSHLMERQGQLINRELQEKATDIKEATISLVTAGVVMFVGLVSLAATATLLLNFIAPLWVSSLIVTVGFLLIGGVMLGVAKKKLEPENLRPNRSIQAFSEISHTLKEKVNEITRH